MSNQPYKRENEPFSVQRSDYGRNHMATAIFVIGRLATGPIQYAILRAHPLGYFGVSRPATDGVFNIFGRAVPRLPFLAALMPTVLAAKHSLWQIGWCRERMTGQFVAFAIIADLLYESVTTLVYTGSSMNPLFSARLFYVGTTIFFSALGMETVAEIQRAVFKGKAENVGLLCTTGFWAVTRHINYTMNVLFGFGVGLATGGPGYSVATAGMYLTNFVTNAMPDLEAYCASKYGQQWTDYTRKTPYQLIPFIY